jgi:hypothetical protein
VTAATEYVIPVCGNTIGVVPVMAAGCPRVEIMIAWLWAGLDPPQILFAVTVRFPLVAPQAKSKVMVLVPWPEMVAPVPV